MAGVPDDNYVRRYRAYYSQWTNSRPEPQLSVTDNPITKTLLGPTGEVIRQWRDRPPVGFAHPSEDQR